MTIVLCRGVRGSGGIVGADKWYSIGYRWELGGWTGDPGTELWMGGVTMSSWSDSSRSRCISSGFSPSASRATVFNTSLKRLMV